MGFLNSFTAAVISLNLIADTSHPFVYPFVYPFLDYIADIILLGSLKYL